MTPKQIDQELARAHKARRKDEAARLCEVNEAWRLEAQAGRIQAAIDAMRTHKRQLQTEIKRLRGPRYRQIVIPINVPDEAA